MSKRFYNKCRRVARLSFEFQKETSDLGTMFEERYGVTYNDIDEDWLIDCFDYGQGGLPSLDEIDRMMAQAGHPVKQSN